MASPLIRAAFDEAVQTDCFTEMRVAKILASSLMDYTTIQLRYLLLTLSLSQQLTGGRGLRASECQQVGLDSFGEQAGLADGSHQSAAAALTKSPLT